MPSKAESGDSTKREDNSARSEQSTDREQDESEHQRLQDLFRSITGTDEVVESQDATESRRTISETDEESVSGYVAELARDDGLDDAVPEPDGTSG